MKGKDVQLVTLVPDGVKKEKKKMVCFEIKLVRIGLLSLELIMTSKIIVLQWCWFIVAKSISLNQQQQERLRKEFVSILP